jgi:succinoglycan biosynthesis transport protein ExoP
MREFLTRIQEQFNRVILDSPPFVSVTDAALLAVQAEGVLLVVKAEAVPRKAALDTRDKLQELKAHILGTVLNDIPVHREGYFSHYYHPRYYDYAKADAGVPRVRRSRRPPSHMGWVKDCFSDLRKRFSSRT